MFIIQLVKSFGFRLLWNVQRVVELVYTSPRNMKFYEQFLCASFKLDLFSQGCIQFCSNRNLNSTSNESACVVKALCGCIVSLYPAYILAMHSPLKQVLVMQNLYTQLKYSCMQCYILTFLPWCFSFICLARILNFSLHELLTDASDATFI